MGASAGAELNAEWQLGRSVLMASGFIMSRWTPFTWTTTLESDPTTSASASYAGQHTLLGVALGYGWVF